MNTLDHRFEEINKLKNKKDHKMNITQEQLDQDNTRTELLNDLVATTTVMDEVWRYHPDNPQKKDVVKEYNILQQIIKDIELELKELDS
tara:strand:- start:217 stop:483 length:267 start_codon:yes stop_codon:yes gene_type:complete